MGVGTVTGFFYEVLMVVAIVTVHELGHVAAAHWFGWRIRRIELLPFGGVFETDETGTKPFHEELCVVLAGPAQHIGLFFCSFLMVGTPLWSAADHAIFTYYNVALLCFNLLPLWPLDGSRCYLLLLEWWLPYRKALVVHLFTSAGFFISFVLMTAVFFTHQLQLWAILIFLSIMWWERHKKIPYIFIRFLVGRLDKPPSAPIQFDIVDQNATIRSLLYSLKKSKTHCYWIKPDRYKLEEKDLLDLSLREHDWNRELWKVFGPAF